MDILKLMSEGQSESTYECSIEFIYGRAAIQFKDEIPDKSLFCNGFQLINEHDGQLQADYSEYKYIYKYLSQYL